MIDLSEDLLTDRVSRYLAVPQLKSLLLQELLLSGIHYQTTSSGWLRYTILQKPAVCCIVPIGVHTSLLHVVIIVISSSSSNIIMFCYSFKKYICFFHIFSYLAL